MKDVKYTKKMENRQLNIPSTLPNVLIKELGLVSQDKGLLKVTGEIIDGVRTEPELVRQRRVIPLRRGKNLVEVDAVSYDVDLPFWNGNS